MRIGHGFDAHTFEEGRPLILGGVNIPYIAGMLGHSDGDVVIHSLCDALLGAAGLGDIGKYFPATPEFKNIDSRHLLRKVMKMLKERSYYVSNIDLTIVIQEPKISPFYEAMKECLGHDLEMEGHQINIKATTTDHMGFTGRKEGVASFAVVLIDLTSNKGSKK